MLKMKWITDVQGRLAAKWLFSSVPWTAFGAIAREPVTLNGVQAVGTRLNSNGNSPRARGRARRHDARVRHHSIHPQHSATKLGFGPTSIRREFPARIRPLLNAGIWSKGPLGESR